MLYCTRWSDTVAFYRDVLEFPVELGNEWFVEFRLGDGSYLSIADAARASIDAVDGKGITLAWRVADVRSIHGWLVGRGAQPTPITRRWGSDVCYLYDPEGHRIEFWTGG